MRIINENPIEGFKAALQSSEQLHELEEYFEIAPKEDIIKLWSKVKSDIQHLVNNLQINRLDSDEKYEESLKNIHAVANAIKIFSTKCKIRTTALIQTVEILVGLLDALSADQSAIEELVKSAISCICEQWFLKTEPSCNQWLPQVITYLLVESLKPSSKESTVKRLCNIKLGFEELDLSTAGADFSKDLLLRCFLHPTFLKSADGMKFLAYLLTISNGYIFESALRVIKSQLLSGGKSISKIYGEMLQKAWKETTNSNESWATDFENYLQDLVHDAVHSADPKYFRGLRLLIKAFHDVKRTDTFEEMLVRVFEPILWRSLRCANATVRSQAAVLFLDVFPLQRINGKPEECDQLLQKQFDQLISLLKDGDHRVRATAISGTFHILREYWDILPGGTVQNILKFIFETLAFDVSSANVRFCVISGIRELLQQPLSHQSLRILLPLIANSIHDKAEKNRLAFVRLLNDVKALRGIHFYEIVSVPHLLERFAEDRKNQEISCAMCQLLLDSFYPQNDSSQPKSAAGKELVARCIQFVEESPLAAEAFYSNLHSHIAMGSVIKLCVMLFHVLHSSILEATKPSKGNKGKRSRNESDEKDFQQPILKDDVVIGFVRVIYALLDSVKHNLAGENFCLELLYKYFTPEKFMAVFNCLLQKYNDRLEVGIACLRLTQALLFIAQCPEGSHFFTACQNLSINYWIQDVAQSLIVKSSNFTIHQEICRIIMDIFFAGNMVVCYVLHRKCESLHSLQFFFRWIS
jgi:condensin-2 complex subunit G2